MNIADKIAGVDWTSVTAEMHEKGFAVVPGLLDSVQCSALITDYDNPAAYRKTVVMARYRFGLGEYKYFNYPLPALIQTIREQVYTHLSPIANAWMKALSMDTRFPDSLNELLDLCHHNGQPKATVLILKYGAGGHNTLHQDLYGAIYFPIQMVIFLNEPGEDYTGGEFVLTQQVPRAQSKAVVQQPKKGDLLIFTTSFRPAKGSKGYYRAYMKHGVSEVHSGKRHTLGIIFHDAAS